MFVPTCLWITLGTLAWGLVGPADVVSAAEKSKNSSPSFAVSILLKTEGHSISFDKKQVKVPYGRQVAITYHNQAEVGSEISHNVAVLAPGSKGKVFGILQKNGYNINGLTGLSEVIAISETLLPKQSATISFRPEGKGTYHYVCLMPGHGDVLDMTGDIIVE